MGVIAIEGLKSGEGHALLCKSKWPQRVPSLEESKKGKGGKGGQEEGHRQNPDRGEEITIFY